MRIIFYPSAREWLLLIGLLLGTVAANARTIVGAEYFFDTDPGRGNGTAIYVPPDVSVNFNFSPVLTGLSVGQHTLYVRTVDDTNSWSAPIPKLMQIRADVDIVTPPLITGGEYFFGTDPGLGSGNAMYGQYVTPDTIPVGLSLFGRTLGQHVLYFRVTDTQGHWSATVSKPFMVRADIPVSFFPPAVQNVEYFFDTDPGMHNGFPAYGHFTAIDTIHFTPTISGLPVGQHLLCMRVYDTNGRNTATFAKPFMMRPDIAATPQPHLSAMEYYIDTDPGLGNGTSITTLQHDTANVFPGISFASLSVGEHTWYVRTRDNNGLWSPTQSKPIQVRANVTASAQPTVNRLEWFFDTDPGFGSATSVTITPGAAVSGSFNVNNASYPNGYHGIYSRARDTNGKWSGLFYHPDTIRGDHPPTVLHAIPDVSVTENFGQDTLARLDTVFADLDIPVGDHLTYLQSVVGSAAFCVVSGNYLLLLSFTNRTGPLFVTVTATDTGLAQVTTSFNVTVNASPDVPIAPTISLGVQYPDAIISWSPVTTTVHNNPVVVTRYLVYYRSAMTFPWEFHGYLDSNSTVQVYHYTHRGVVQYNQSMYYKVQALSGGSSSSDSIIKEALAETQTRPVTEEELERRLKNAVSIPVHSVRHSSSN